MARKSLIEPGLIPAEGDVFSRILANDRQRRRQDGALPSPDPVDTDSEQVPHPEEPQVGKIAVETSRTSAQEEAPPVDEGLKNERTNVTTLQEKITPDVATTALPSPARKASAQRRGNDALRGRASAQSPPGIALPTGAAGDPVAVAPALRAERYQKALSLTKTDEIAVVTVRVSAKLNEYMDRYVERCNRLHPKSRWRKQDAIAEAFAAFFADHPLPPAPADEEI